MAEVQSALPAAFMQVVGAHKAGPKTGLAASVQLTSFFGVLKSQLTRRESPETLARLEPTEESAALALDGEVAQKPMLVEKEMDVSLPVHDPEISVASSTLQAQSQPTLPLPSGMVLNVAMMEQPKGALPQEPDVDVLMPQPSQQAGTNEVAAKLLVPVKPDSEIKLDGAAMTADSGQVLPSVALPTPVATALPLVESRTEVSSDTLVASVLSPLGRAPSEPVVSAPLTLSHPFEQVLRQAEAKLNVAIEAPVRSAAFVAELSDKVVWLAGRQGQVADLSLNPPQMGSLEVRLTLSGSDASAQFYSANPVVRETLDAALPKLRELMAQAGITLGEADVRDQAFDQRDAAAFSAKNAPQTAEHSVSQAALAGIGAISVGGHGLVDLYI